MQTELENVTINTPSEWVIEPEVLLNKESSSVYLHTEKQVHFDLKENYFRHVIQFNTLESIQNNSVLEFNVQQSETLVWHRLRLIRGDEHIDKLLTANMKFIQKESNSHHYIYTGSWTLVIILDDIREGDILDYSYSYKYTHRNYGSFNQESFYLQFDCPVESLYCRLIATPDKSNIKYYHTEIQPKTQFLDNSLQEWIWHTYKTSSSFNEPNQPSWYNPVPRILISSFPDWETVATNAQAIFPSCELTPNMEKQITAWKEKYLNRIDLITAIVRFVQKEIRYLSLDIGRIADGAALTPSETFSKRFGDCKDKTLLLHVLLKEIGVVSYPALVHTWLRERIIEVLPALSFNHAILAIEYDGKTYWVDSTCSYQGGNFLDSSSDFKYALLVGHTSQSLVRIDSTGLKGKYHSLIDLDLTNKNAALTITTTFYNSQADEFREKISNSKENELEERYLNYYKYYFPSITQSSPVTIEELPNGNCICARESYTISGHVEHIFPFTVHEAARIPLESDRKTPLHLTHLDINEEIIVHYPGDMQFIPDIIDLTNEHFVFTEKRDNPSKGTYRIVYSLKSLKDSIAPEAFPTVRDFIKILSTKGFEITEKTKIPAPPPKKMNMATKIALIASAPIIFELLANLIQKFVK